MPTQSYQSPYGIISYVQEKNKRDYQEDRADIFHLERVQGENMEERFKAFVAGTHERFKAELDQELMEQTEPEEGDPKPVLHQRMGSTFSAVHLSKDTLTIVNLGDSPVILISVDRTTSEPEVKIEQLTEDHNLMNQKETEKHQFERHPVFTSYLMNTRTGKAGVNLTRTFCDYGCGVLREPDVRTINLREYLKEGHDIHLIIASDGLVESKFHEDMLKVIYKDVNTLEGRHVADVVNTLLYTSQDNITAYSIHLSKQLLQEMPEADLVMEIADGHGGDTISEKVKQLFREFFAGRIQEVPEYTVNYPETQPATPQEDQQEVDPGFSEEQQQVAMQNASAMLTKMANLMGITEKTKILMLNKTRPKLDESKKRHVDRTIKESQYTREFYLQWIHNFPKNYACIIDENFVSKAAFLEKTIQDVCLENQGKTQGGAFLQ